MADVYEENQQMANSNKPALSSWPLATSNNNGKNKGNGKRQEQQQKPFATDPRPAGTGLRLCATIRNSVTTLVNTARNAGQTSVTEVHLRSRDG